MNKKLLQIIKKTVSKHHKHWHNALDNALWVDRVIPLIYFGTYPYFLVYGKEAILPPNIYLLSLQLSQSTDRQSSSFLQSRIDAFLKLEDERNEAKEKFHVHQQRIKR